MYPWEWVNIGMNIILIKSASVSLMVEQAAVLKVTKQQLDTKRFLGLKLAKVCIRDFYKINYIRKKWHGTDCNGLLLIQLSTVSIVLFESINFGIAQILLNCKFLYSNYCIYFRIWTPLFPSPVSKPDNFTTAKPLRSSALQKGFVNRTTSEKLNLQTI